MTKAAGLGLCTTPLWSGADRVMADSDAKSEKGAKDKKMPTGLVSDQRYLKHSKGGAHPESPERLMAIHAQLEKSGLDKELVPIPTDVQGADPLPYIKMIHSEKHIEQAGKQAHDDAICRLAVSGALSAVDAVCTGKVTNAFAAIRPPGHHAANNGEFGFCFYNNVAVAARYAQKKHGLKKILIVDWDYHHGDGTEWAFYDDPSVLVFSTHALYAFPRSGAAEKIGKGKGKGFNINAPLPRGADDKAVMQAFREKLMPAAEKFRPDLVLISAGFDARHDDTLGDFNFTDQGFARLTELVMTIAKKHSRSRIVSLLEGGYNVQGLSLAVDAHLRALMKA
ncbi:MAG: histone deacetylase [Akkermansiaceae bacterium]